MFYTEIDVKAKERLYKEIGELMLAHGFSADVPYWRCSRDETIASLFIENYRSGFLFHISLGVYAIGLGDKRTRKPKLPQMHAWTRLSQLTPITTIANGNIALRGDGTVNTGKIVDEVLEAVKTVGLGVLNELASLDGTKRVLDHYGDMRWQISPILREKLYGNRLIQISGKLPLREWEITGSVNPFHKPRA